MRVLCDTHAAGSEDGGYFPDCSIERFARDGWKGHRFSRSLADHPGPERCPVFIRDASHYNHTGGSLHLFEEFADREPGGVIGPRDRGIAMLRHPFPVLHDHLVVSRPERLLPPDLDHLVLPVARNKDTCYTVPVDSPKKRRISSTGGNRAISFFSLRRGCHPQP